MIAKTEEKFRIDQIQTATKEQLLLMLYDGVISTCEQAIKAIRADHIARAHNVLVKAQEIITELMDAQCLQVEEEIDGRLYRLYAYIRLRLIEANLNLDEELVEEVLTLIRPLSVIKRVHSWSSGMKFS